MTTIENEDTTDLVAGLITDVKDLAVGVQAEVRQEISNLKAALLRMAVKIAMIVVSAVLAGHALAAGFGALEVPMWAAYALSAAIMVAIGIAILKRLSPPVPVAEIERSRARPSGQVERDSAEA